MAGSYLHLVDDDSEGDAGGWSLIENMGDAHGCVEELLWLVRRSIGHEEAVRLLHSEFYPMERGEIPPDASHEFVKRVMYQ